MNKSFKIIILFLFLASICLSSNLIAKEKEKKRELNYTYIGLVTSVGLSHVTYTDWFKNSNSMDTKKFMQVSITGGLLINVFVKHFSGDFSIQYAYDIHDIYKIHHLFYSMSGKYVWFINKIFDIGLGAGLYFESPPSNKKFHIAGGGQIPVSFIVKTTFNTKLIFDLFIRYGFFGMGDAESTKLSYGINIGFIFKVGRI